MQALSAARAKESASPAILLFSALQLQKQEPTMFYSP